MCMRAATVACAKQLDLHRRQKMIILLMNHTPSITLLPLNSARVGYATEGGLFISARVGYATEGGLFISARVGYATEGGPFISAQLSTGTVGALQMF